MLTIHSLKGFEGGLLISGSADHSIRSIQSLKKANLPYSLGLAKEENFKQD